MSGSCLRITIWCLGGMSDLLPFITFRTWDWKEIVGSLVVARNLFVSMKSEILDSYCLVCRITREFPLSTRVIMASFSFSLVFMFLATFASWFVLCL